jgi:hypothetical protein
MLLVILLFTRNPNLPLQLDNSPRNFPLGSITAVYSPDTGVFLDFASWNSWYLLTSANFVVFLALFLVLNWNVKRRERGIRFVFYSGVFLVLPVIANILNVIFLNQSTIGPSGAFYTSEGLLTGFSLVNLWAGDASGGFSKMTGRIDPILFVLNALFGTFLLLASFVDPVDFFSEVITGFAVGYGIHIFCYYFAIGAVFLLAYSRRSYLTVPKLTSIDTDLVV